MQPEKPPYDSGNPDQVRGKKNRSEILRERDRKDTSEFMGTPGNRRLYWWLLSSAHVEDVSYRPGATHAEMAFRDGQKNFANLLRARVMTVCPDLHFLAMKEAQKEDNPNE